MSFKFNGKRIVNCPSLDKKRLKNSESQCIHDESSSVQYTLAEHFKSTQPAGNYARLLTVPLTDNKVKQFT